MNPAKSPRGRGPKTDLSGSTANSTGALQAAYHQLMAITDLPTLQKTAIDVVQKLVGSGISPENFKKFQANVANSPTVQKLQYYLTNYILKGSGLGVAESAQESMGSLLTEDVGEYLNEEQQKLADMVAEYGLYVKKI